MVESGIGDEDDGNLSIDWDDLLQNIHPREYGSCFDSVDQPGLGVSLSIDEVDKYFLDDKSDDAGKEDQIAIDECFADVFLDLSPQSKDPFPSSDSAEVGTDREEKGNRNTFGNRANFATQTESNNDAADISNYNDGDPDEKTRKRKMTNRDAAVRSRERKKIYLKDLEMKSKYYEAECKRLGMLFQCCLAENHALRSSLHNSKAYDASTMTKQESAVLLLESLPLGSLLGFLVTIICLCILLPSRLLLLALQNMKGIAPEAELRRSSSCLAPRMAGTSIKLLTRYLVHPLAMDKKYRSSRSRMKKIC